jgi:hypothetical protein
MPPVATADEWNAMRPAEREAHIAGRWGYLPASKYWLGKLTTWPLLARVALWHLGFPTSSISIERVFAKMRMMGQPQRLSADNETFARELFLRANITLFRRVLRAKLSAVEDF